MSSQQDLMRRYIDILNEMQGMAEDSLAEKWGVPTKVSPEERGKYAGKTKAELLKSYNALKRSGPHKKGSPEYGRMRELAFAIRAKSDWGKVREGHMPPYTKEQANYTDHGSGPDRCRDCRFFLSPNRCRRVQGTINPDGWCKFFQARD